MSRRLRGPGPGRGSGAAEDAHGDAEGLQCGEWRPIVQIERVLPDLAELHHYLAIVLTVLLAARPLFMLIKYAGTTTSLLVPVATVGRLRVRVRLRRLSKGT